MTPRASSNRIVLDGDAVRVYVTAAPTDGEANEAVIALLAKALKVPKTSLQVVRGQTSREKLIDLGDLEPGEARQRLQQA